MNEKLDQLVNDVAEIKTALVGNTKLGIKGIIKEHKELMAWKDRMNLRIAFWSGMGATIVFITKAGIEYLARK